MQERTKKTLVHWPTWLGWRVPKVTKVFCFFSSEKKAFLSSHAAAGKARPACNDICFNP
jgi:hypothetical protein